MFARHVTLKLKTDSIGRLPEIIENEILPLLRLQKGFRDEITLVNVERSEAVGISLWDTKEDAEAYNKTGYAEVLRILSLVVDGTPAVEIFEVATFEVVNATFYKVAGARA
jgi:hypothetical protein